MRFLSALVPVPVPHVESAHPNKHFPQLGAYPDSQPATQTSKKRRRIFGPHVGSAGPPSCRIAAKARVSIRYLRREILRKELKIPIPSRLCLESNSYPLLCFQDTRGRVWLCDSLNLHHLAPTEITFNEIMDCSSSDPTIK